MLAVENVALDDEEDDIENLEFEEIPPEQFDDASDSEVDESLEQAVRNISEKQFFGGNYDYKCFAS